MTSFFAAFDALCEEGIATSVCRALDEVADISVPGKVFPSFFHLREFTLVFQGIELDDIH